MCYLCGAGECVTAVSPVGGNGVRGHGADGQAASAGVMVIVQPRLSFLRLAVARCAGITLPGR